MAKYKMRKDGRYMTQVWDGTYDERGVKRRKTLYSSKSSKDLERKVAAFERERDEGTLTVNSGMLFADYCRAWLALDKAVRAPGTQTMYRNVIERHIAPVLPDLKLSDVKRIHFQQIIAANKDKPRTCQQINITFRQVIKSAVRDAYLPERAIRTICDGVELPKYIAPEKRALRADEKEAIKTANFRPADKAFVYIIYGCGLRRGEVLALTKADIGKSLNVDKSLAFDKNVPYLKDTKNHKKRSVPMPEWCHRYISEYMATISGDILFPYQDSYLSVNAYHAMWKRILTAMRNEGAECSGLTAHIFRHNYCASLCQLIPEISIKKIAELLGDSEKMVLEVYNHALDTPEKVEQTVEKAVEM